MFETSVIHAQAAAARGRVPLLGISIVAHSAVVIGAVAVSIASVSFPAHAPKEFALAPMLMRVTVPPPLGNPNGGATQKPQPQPAQKPQTPPPLTAPAQTPDVTPVATQPAATATTGDPTTTAGPGTEPGPRGQLWGTEGSLGDLDAPPATSTAPAAPPVEQRIYRVGEVKAPVLLHRVEPVYPPMFVRAHMPGKVALHCVIDKNGRVHDAQVVFATNSAFADAVLRSLDSWRYTPASLHGEAVDCYLDLSVDFGVR
jgi:periplasmic protein TonB